MILHSFRARVYAQRFLQNAVPAVVLDGDVLVILVAGSSRGCDVLRHEKESIFPWDFRSRVHPCPWKTALLQFVGGSGHTGGASMKLL